MSKFSEKQYFSAGRKLLPRGPIWKGRILNQVINGMAKDAVKTDNDIEILAKNMLPSTCEELLSDYEKMYGLPDDCTIGEQSLIERKEALLSKTRKKEVPTVAWLKSYAKSMGYYIDIITHKHFICGISKCGDRLGGAIGSIRIEVLNSNHSYNKSEFECRLNKILPADVDIFYSYKEVV